MGWITSGGIPEAPIDGNTYGRKDGAWAIAGTEIPQVTAFADLPAAVDHSGEIYVVLTTTGVPFITRKKAGFYISDGSVWSTVEDISAIETLTTDSLTIGTLTGILKGTTGSVSVASAGTDYQAALTFGIADTNKVQINAADVADNDYAKFTATGLEGRSYSEVLSDIGAQPAGSYEAPLTFSNGLTRTVNAVANDLITGKAGGQTIIGGTAASENITLSSTSNATKGKILFGTSAYDEVNNRSGIGTTSPDTLMHISQANATAVIRMERVQTSISSSDILARIEVETTDTTDAGVCASIAALAYGSSCETGWRFQVGTPSSLIEAVQIDYLGFVGIGTPWPDSPDTILHIQHATDPYIRLTRDDTTVTAGEIIGRIEFETKDTGSAGIGAYIQAIAEGTAGETGIAIATGAGGAAAERMNVTTAGNVGIATTTPISALDISSGGLGLTIGANSSSTTRTDATSKNARIGSYHFTNAEEPVTMILAVNASGANTLFFGGGSSLQNAATELRFFTDASSTATTGAERVSIDSARLKVSNAIFNLGTIDAASIASGAITLTSSHMKIDTEEEAASDDLDTINGGVDGDVLILRTTTATRDVTIKHATGNIRLAGSADVTLNYAYSTITLIYTVAQWCEISRSLIT